MIVDKKSLHSLFVIKEGYITCWSGDKEYITYKTIKTPNPGCEVNVYLYPSGLDEVIYR